MSKIKVVGKWNRRLLPRLFLLPSLFYVLVMSILLLGVFTSFPEGEPLKAWAIPILMEMV